MTQKPPKKYPIDIRLWEELQTEWSISHYLRDSFPECQWWKVAGLSIYYDPYDSLGSVGAPYYEILKGDTTRYIKDQDEEEMIRFILKSVLEKTQHRKHHPEDYL